MKKLGTVENVIHDGTVLLRMEPSPASETPPQGAPVFDRRENQVGTVARVFGPVKVPYISLRSRPGTDTLGLMGASLYLDPERPAEQRRAGKQVRTFARRGGAGSHGKKGVKTYRRKEKPRKR